MNGSGQKKKILLVEDEMALSAVYRSRLELEGFDVREVHNGEDALSATVEYRPDLILLDLQMPNMNGVEALSLIRAFPSHKQTPVIVLTNLGEEEAPDGLRKLGVHSYIVKADFTPRQVVERVKHALNIR